MSLHGRVWVDGVNRRLDNGQGILCHFLFRVMSAKKQNENIVVSEAVCKVMNKDEKARHKFCCCWASGVYSGGSRDHHAAPKDGDMS